MIFGQNEPIKGRCGNNDLRIRAGNGLIEKGHLKKFDFNKTGLKSIAVVYKSGGDFGLKEIGFTVFENTQQK